jgi:hypothetical protein
MSVGLPSFHRVATERHAQGMCCYGKQTLCALRYSMLLGLIVSALRPSTVDTASHGCAGIVLNTRTGCDEQRIHANDPAKSSDVAFDACPLMILRSRDCAGFCIRCGLATLQSCMFVPVLKVPGLNCLMSAIHPRVMAAVGPSSARQSP